MKKIIFWVEFYGSFAKSVQKLASEIEYFQLSRSGRKKNVPFVLVINLPKYKYGRK